MTFPLVVGYNLTITSGEERVLFVDEEQEQNQILINKWDSMTVNELYDQLNILHDRYFFALKIGNTPLAEQIDRGRKQLQQLIDSKSDGISVT